jgi:cytochrome c-type biogenesis protein CcmF
LFLTFGISLGAHWAYAVLGWGGYWGWDPVENASLLPWLSTTAFLHSVMMQEKRGMMKVWNVWLIFITFMLSILGTMLTRSGMVSSVHAFAQSSIGTWFAGFLGITAVVCFVFFFLNRDHLRSENKLESLVSRESSFLFNNLVLLGACFAVLCGTLFPMLSEAVRGVKMNLGAPFYNKVMVPIGLFLIFLTGVGPLLAWRNTSVGSIKRNFAVPATIALCIELVVSGILIKNGVRFWTDTGQMYAMLSFCLSTLVVATVASEFIRGGIVWKNKLQTNLAFGMYQLTRRNMRRYGGYVVHFGVVLVVIGLAGAAFNHDVEQEIGKGDRVAIGRYTLVGEEYTEDDNANYRSQAALLDVYKDGKFLTRLNPEERFFKASGGQPVHIVANHSTLNEDLYVVYEGHNPDTDHPIIKAMINPLVNWIWIGVLVIAFGTGMALVPNATVMSVPAPSAVAVASMEKQGMQPAGVGK